jgi:RNA polymerase sigma-70 factor, ECF subfamily
VHQDDDDHILLARLAAGEPAALEDLYDRHARITLAVILRVVQDRQIAEELLQEAMLQLWRHASRYDGRAGGVRPWLLTIAHNLALNDLRRRRRHPQDTPHVRAVDDTLMESIFDPGATPEDAVWDSTRRKLLTTAIDDLSTPQQEILSMYARGYSQSEIAERLDQPLGTVKTRMRRGLLQLRAALHPHGQDLT